MGGSPLQSTLYNVSLVLRLPTRCVGSLGTRLVQCHALFLFRGRGKIRARGTTRGFFFAARTRTRTRQFLYVLDWQQLQLGLLKAQLLSDRSGMI